jgi:hypothetical protein
MILAELKAAAEAASECPEEAYDRCLWDKYHRLANPATILKLIAVVEAAESCRGLKEIREALKELEK